MNLFLEEIKEKVKKIKEVSEVKVELVD